MRSFLKISAGLIVALVIAIVVVFTFVIDPNDFKGDIIAGAEAELGREVRIDGNIDLKLGLTTALTVDGVRVANAPWADEPEMLTVESFAVEVAVLPLLRGNLEVKGLLLRGTRILLERSQAGEVNWEFGGSGEDSGATRDGPSAPDGPGDGDFSVPTFQNVDIEDVRIAYRDATADQDVDVALDAIRLTSTGPDQPMEFELEGSYDELPVRVEGEVGALLTLIRNTRLPVSLRAEAFGLAAAIDGSIAEPLAAAGLDLRVAVSGEDLSAVAGTDLRALGPLAMTAAVRGDTAGIEFADLQLTLGQSELIGSLKASLGGQRPKLTGHFQAPLIDLTALAPTADGEAPEPAKAAPAEPKTAPANATPGPDRVLPGDPLRLDGMRAVDIDILLDLAVLDTPSLDARDVTIGVRLDNGVLTVDPVSATVADSPLTGHLGLDATTDTVALEVDLKIPDLDLGTLLQELNGEDIIRGDAAIDVSLRGAGDSVAAIAGSLNGHARILMDEGMVRADAIDLLVGGVTAVITTVVSGREFSAVKCVALDAEFEDGKAATTVLADTELSLITVDGSIDLTDESLRLKVTPRPKTPTLNAVIPLEIRGTLANPSITLDPIAAATKLGGIVFPAAALLALGDLGAKDVRCVRDAAEEAEQLQPQAAQNPTPEQSEDFVDKLAKDLFRFLGKN